MRTASDLARVGRRAWAALGALAIACACAGTARAAITWDNSVSGGSAGTMELVRDTTAGSPSGQYLGLKFSSSVPLTNVYARAIVGGVGYALDATESQDHFIGDLSTTLKTSYWFLNYPATTTNGTLQVQIYSGGPPGVGTLQGTSVAYTLQSADVDQAASANKVSSVVVNGGATIILGQPFDVVVCYDVNSANATNVLVGPAASAGFDPGSVQLLDVPSVQLWNASGCGGTLLSTSTNKLYYPGIGSSSLAALRATYRFRAMNVASGQLSPIVSARSGQYKYNPDFAAPGAGVSYTIQAATNSVVLAKSVNVTSSPGAATVTYTLTATNSGMTAVTLDSFVDTLPSSPAAVSYVAGSSLFNGAATANPVISGQVLTWGDPGGANAFTIPAGASRSLTFQASVPANPGAYTNTAIAKIGAVTIDTTLATGDSTPASAVTRIGAPVLTVGKSTSTPSIDGTTATYTLTVTNNGGSAAAGVALTDTLPAGFTYASHSAPVLGGGATRTSTSDPAAGATAPTWGAFNLPSGGSVAITFNANVAAGVANGVHDNSASATTTTTPATIDNFNGATQTSDNVTATSALLTVGKSTSTPTVTQTAGGTTATYTITVTNAAAATAIAAGVVLTDTLPAGFSYASHGAPVLAGGATRPTITNPTVGDTAPAWGGFSLPSGASVSITFVANVASGVLDGTYSNSAAATTTTQRRTITNFDGAAQTSDDVTVSTALTPPTIAKAFAPAIITTGGTSTLTFTLGNANAVPLLNATFTDTLTNMSVASTAIGGTCASVSNTPALAVGATALSLAVPSLPAGGCTITVTVTSSVTGLHPNTTSGVTTTQTPTASAPSNTATLEVVAPPALVVSKTTSTPTVSNTGAGATATYSVTVTNTGGAAATGVTLTDTLPAGFTYATTGSVSLNGTTTSAYSVSGTSTPSWTTNPAGGFTINPGQTLVIVFSAAIDAGVVSGTHHNSAAATSSNAVSITNFDGAASSTDDVTVSTGSSIHGVVYADANHNAQRDAGEAGTQVTLYVKRLNASTPTGPALDVAAVDPVTGVYSFAGVAPGQALIVLDDNGNPADVTPTLPAGWLGTEMGDGRRVVTVTGADVPDQNFGLFAGSKVTGRVFDDNGSGGAVPNDSVQQGSEAGLARVTVKATDASGATTWDTTLTDGAGLYTLWIPLAGANTVVRIVQTNLGGYVSVGGAVGTSGGAYARASDTVTFTSTAGGSASGVDFADVRENALAANGQQTAAPSSVVFYAHRFLPGSGGSVAFGFASTPSPAGMAPGTFTHVMHRDSDCNGQLDAGEPVLTAGANILVQANAPLCVIVKLTVGAAPIGATDALALTATFTYTNAGPALSTAHVNTDLTTVGQASSLVLDKRQSTNLVLPGAPITYTIDFSNRSGEALATLRLRDATPAFTRFVSAACVAPLPAGITACTVTQQPGAGASGTIEWALTGSLPPAASGRVTFTVQLEP